VAVWFNGGPGCSSLEGWLSEIGPYVVEDGQLNFNGTLNQWSWTWNATYIWIESPAGVGFSYVDWETEVFGDAVTTQDQYDGLISFFAKFPQLLPNPFYISGESYGGMYVPRLAHWIIANSTNAPYNINLKGITVGDGVGNLSSLNYMTNLMLYQHQFVPDDVWNDYQMCNNYPNSATCQYSTNVINNLVADINAYDIYRYCYQDGLDDDCTDSLGYYFFLNNPGVKAALNVDETIYWISCNNYVGDNFIEAQPGSYPDYLYITNNTINNISVLLYTGDTDSVVPMVDTLAWVQNVGFTPVGNWTPWNTPDQQFAGFVQEYTNGLTYVTVNGCGHMVPQWKRAQAQTMFLSWLYGLAPFPPGTLNVTTTTTVTE